jgi:hypothetical protein
MKIVCYWFVTYYRQIWWIINLYLLHAHSHLHMRVPQKLNSLHTWHYLTLMYKMQLKIIIKCRSPISIQPISKSFYFYLLFIDLHFLFIRLDEPLSIKCRSFLQIFAIVIFTTIAITAGVITVCLTSPKRTSMIHFSWYTSHFRIVLKKFETSTRNPIHRSRSLAERNFSQRMNKNSIDQKWESMDETSLYNEKRDRSTVAQESIIFTC